MSAYERNERRDQRIFVGVFVGMFLFAGVWLGVALTLDRSAGRERDRTLWCAVYGAAYARGELNVGQVYRYCRRCEACPPTNA